MHDGHSSEDILLEPIVPGELSSEPPALPRWLQILTGLILLPVSLFCTACAGTMFSIPKVQSDPLLQLLALAFCLLRVWTICLTFRLVFGLKGKGFFGPFALRFIGVAAIGLVIGGFFTGVWLTHPLRSAILSVVYVSVALRLWKVAAYRARAVA